ncbi:MAG TPA: LysR family transcriptional regulator [Rhodocyclaceae bacterium]
MNYDLDDLRLFVAVAEAASLSKGAAQIHRSPAAASTRLSRLEQSFGTPLLRRRSKGMALTPAGEALLRQARSLLNDVEAMNAEMGAYARGVQGVIRLYANTNATNVFLPQDLASFLAAQPQVNVLLEERPSPEIVAAVAAGAVDIGIVAGEVNQPGLVCHPYRQDQLVLVMAPGHALAKRARRPFVDALEEPFISLDGSSSIHAFLLAQARNAGRTLRLRIQVRSFDSVCRMAAAGVGVGMVPLSAAQQAARSYPLTSVELSDAWATRALQIVIRPESAANRHVAALAMHLAGGSA